MKGKIRKVLIIFTLLALPYFIFALNYTMASDAKSKKAVLIIAYNDFEEHDYFQTKKSLEKNGISIKIVSSQKGKAKGSALEVSVDLLIDQLNVSDYDAIIFIGGLGVVEEYYDNPKADQIAREAAKQGKVLASIGVANRIIYNADVVEYQLPTQRPPGENVIIKENVILGQGHSDIKPFAEAIIKALAEKTK
jgi:protease I